MASMGPSWGMLTGSLRAPAREKRVWIPEEFPANQDFRWFAGERRAAASSALQAGGRWFEPGTAQGETRWKRRVFSWSPCRGWLQTAVLENVLETGAAPRTRSGPLAVGRVALFASLSLASRGSVIPDLHVTGPGGAGGSAVRLSPPGVLR